MPKLCEPERLQDMAITGLIEYFAQLAAELMPSIIAISRVDTKVSAHQLKSRMASIRRYIHYNVPWPLYDCICTKLFTKIPKIIEQLKRNMELRSSMGEFVSRCNVVIAFSEIAMSPFIRSLDFETMPKMIRHLFYNRLNEMHGLRILNLGSLSGGWKTIDMEPMILNGLRTMKHLQHLILNYDCTDNILMALADVCPNIKTLDLSSSKSITNDSCNLLIQFIHLETLQLYRTNVNIEGYIKLLIKLKNLQDVGRYDELGRCLEYIIDNYPDVERFNLQRFTSRFVTTKFLQILANHCPNLYFISIFHNALLCDLMVLCGVTRLCNLHLLSCDFFADQIRDLLAVKGCNLTYLHLEHVDQIDLNALLYISQFCPDLKVLAIYNCELIESTSLYTTGNKSLQIPPFINLERLTLIARCTVHHLEFLLFNCYNIQAIHLGTMVPTNDELFQKILARNPLSKLIELNIICSDGLTIDTVYKLIQSCDNLRELYELEGWSQLANPTDLDAIRLYIQMNNIDLRIKSKRFVTN